MTPRSDARGMAGGRPALLLVTEDPALRDRLLPLLATRVEVQVADGPDALLTALAGAAGLLIASGDDGRPDGIDLLRRVRALDPWIPVFLLTAAAEPARILQAGRLGAAAHFLAGEDGEEIADTIAEILVERVREQESIGLSPDDEELQWRFIGESHAIRRLRAQCNEVARYPTSVLITGENGTGKEVLARYIHRQSDRAEREFIAVNCGALPEGLVESELFGHERGAFTGAVKQHRGSFERANGGTLMFDEITEMPVALQPKLLRAIEEREFVRVGGERPIHAEVRLICTTNRDPQQAVAEGKLRRDLLYRINVVTLHIPPLREHREDVPLLARHFLRLKSRELGKRIERFSLAARSLMLSHDWPGNVRELLNLVEQAMVFCRSGEIGPELLGPIAEGAAYLALPWEAARDLALRRFEFDYLSMLLRVHRGSVTDCARTMQISRQALYKLLERIGLDPQSFRPPRGRSRRSPAHH